MGSLELQGILYAESILKTLPHHFHPARFHLLNIQAPSAQHLQLILIALLQQRLSWPFKRTVFRANIPLTWPSQKQTPRHSLFADSK